jgi:hypothetical protein
MGFNQPQTMPIPSVTCETEQGLRWKFEYVIYAVCVYMYARLNPVMFFLDSQLEM